MRWVTNNQVTYATGSYVFASYTDNTISVGTSSGNIPAGAEFTSALAGAVYFQPTSNVSIDIVVMGSGPAGYGSGSGSGYFGITASCSWSGYSVPSELQLEVDTGTSSAVQMLNAAFSGTYRYPLYAVSVGSVSHGSVSVSHSEASPGTTITINAVPDAGYKVGSISVSGNTISGTVFTLGYRDEIVSVTFVPDSYSISYASGLHGSISGPSSATAGSTVSLSISSDTGYELDYYDIAIETVGTVTHQPGTSSLFTMPPNALTITPYFKLKEYGVILSVESGGSEGCTASGPATATYGETVIISVSPATGWQFSYLTVGNTTHNTTSFNMPNSGVTVEVYFVKTEYNITVHKGTGVSSASTSPSGTATYGTTVTVSASASSGYTISSKTWNGNNISGSTFIMPASDVDVWVYATRSEDFTVSVGTGTLYYDTYGTYTTSTYVSSSYFNGSSSSDKTSATSWSLSKTGVVTVSSNGTISVVGAGTVTITGSWNGWSDSVSITVAACTYSLSASASRTTLWTGETEQLSAVFTTKRGNTTAGTSNVTSSVTWSSGATGKATVSSGGLVTAGGTAGGVSITASYRGKTSSVSMTINTVTRELVVSPSSGQLTVGGETLNLTATYYVYARTNTSQNVSGTATWSSNYTVRATVSGGTVTSGNTAGVARITASYDGYSDYADITINLAVKSITYGNPTVTLSGASDIPAYGGSISSCTISYTQVETTTWSDNSTTTRNITSGGSVSWDSVTAGLAAIGAARTSVGTLTATVTLNGKTGTGSTTIYQAANTEALGTLTISADPGAVVIGHDPASLIATITYPAGQTSSVTRDTTFQSDNTSIATVSGSSVTGVGSGTVTITGTYSGKTATTSLQSGTEAEMTSLLIVENTTPELGMITVSGAVDVNDIYKPGTDVNLNFKCSEFNNKGGTSSSDVTTLFYGESESTDTGYSNVYYNIGNNISDTDTFSSDNITLQYYIDEENSHEDTSYAYASVYFNNSRLGYVEMLPSTNNYGGQFSYDDVYKSVSRTLTSLLGGSSQNVTGSQLKSLYWHVVYGWYGIKIGTTLKITSQVASTEPKNYYSTYYGSQPVITFVPNFNCYFKSALTRNIEFGTKSQAIASFNISDISSNYSGIGDITSLVERNYGYSSSTSLTADCTAVGNITSIDIYFRPTTSVNRTLFANLATAKSCTSANVYVKIYRGQATYLSTGTAQLFNGNVSIGSAVACQTSTASYTVVPLPLDQAIDLMQSPDFHVHLEWSCIKTATGTARKISAYGAGVDLTCLVIDTDADYTTLSEADVTSQVINDVYTYPAITSIGDRALIAGFADATGKFYNKVNYSKDNYSIIGHQVVRNLYIKISGSWVLADLYKNAIKPLEQGQKFKRKGYNITPIILYDYIRTDGTGYIEIPFEDCPYIPGQSALQIAFSKVDGGSMSPTGTSAATVLDWGDSGCYIQFTSSNTTITLTTNYLNNVNGTLYKYTGAKSKVAPPNYEVLMVRSWGQGTSSSNASTCGFLYKGDSTLLELPEIWSTTGATATSASNATGTWTPSNENLQIFGYHSSGVAYPTSTIGGFTLYAFNVYRSTTATSGSDTDVNLEHAFRPASMGDSVGLYDTVTGSYYPGIGGLSVGNWDGPVFYNNGNGSIVNYGVAMPLSDVTILGTQIQSSSDSTTYINTGVSYGPNNKYVIEYEGLHIAVTSKYMGWNGGGCIQKVSNLVSPYGDGVNTYTSDSGMQDIHVTQTIERGTSSNTITAWDYPVGQGGTTTRTHENLRLYATDPLCLFASVSGGITPLKNAKLSSAKIYVNDILVRDFISAQKNSDGTIGMYDRVNGRFYALDTIGGTGGVSS